MRQLLLTATVTCLLSTVPIVCLAQTIHETQQATARGATRDDAHDNAYAQADNTMRMACTVVNGTLENEREDNASYFYFGSAGYEANVLIEADCVTPDASTTALR